MSKVPSGTQTVTGTVLGTKWKAGTYGNGSRDRMVMTLDCGDFKIWGTVPRYMDNDGKQFVGSTLQRGDKITLTANITPKKGSDDFGFYSYPRDGIVLDLVSRVEQPASVKKFRRSLKHPEGVWA